MRRDRARVEELERELGIERKRREEVECMLEDVERECRAPFVVPALLEAFKVVSGVTSKVLDESLPLPAV
ncbi:hypothetical protein AMATHDRAFT_147617 [Amanita thiersii Skay4041]|uniref:Uncharacterized protein n=1 Tax=Amanita thiersii Skay4041 TaxID=703135 RepID=A0A2A9NP34_9AGAR|nr:hypothetical protein AMATHDRAFT_147617 [Amanita thiersii Skay4041]